MTKRRRLKYEKARQKELNSWLGVSATICDAWDKPILGSKHYRRKLKRTKDFMEPQSGIPQETA